MALGLSDLAERFRFDSSFWRSVMAASIERGPDSFLRVAPTVVGVGFGLGLAEHRTFVLENLRRLLGKRSALEEARDVAAVFANYAHCLTEAMLLGTNRGYGLVSNANGVENYEATLKAPKGMIIATAHTGGWEAAGPMLSRARKREVVVVMARERDERARQMQDEMRERAGVKVVHIGDTAFDALPLLRFLKQDAVVAMQIDRVPEGMRARSVTLDGSTWQVPEGPLQIAALSGAPILPVFTRRTGFMAYEANAYPPIFLPKRPTADELDNAALTLASTMVRFLQKNPTQWFHFRDH